MSSVSFKVTHPPYISLSYDDQKRIGFFRIGYREWCFTKNRALKIFNRVLKPFTICEWQLYRCDFIAVPGFTDTKTVTEWQ